MDRNDRCGYYYILKSWCVVTGQMEHLVNQVETSSQTDSDTVDYSEDIPTDVCAKYRKLEEQAIVLYIRLQKVNKYHGCSLACPGRFRGGNNFYGCPWQHEVNSELSVVGSSGVFLTDMVIKPIIKKKVTDLLTKLREKRKEFEKTVINFKE